ncbi:MBL fold metallo-hydrolase [Anaerovorax sp. IOR16]|uniref:MBL fold metallo-hydrolase n=1 Tax=Anaerovorax sp. IOR16 TaxID=2773458 RepID=UPI0019D15DC0|nr:MBL fold metallo-hydrolase [Anaerovorax sp. IOR16]
MIVKGYYSGALQVNSYLVYDEETKKGFIVDPGGVNAGLLQKVEEEDIDILYIVLTHGHGDHIGGVGVHQQAFPKAKLVASKKEEDFLKDPSLNFSKETCGVSLSLEADLYVEEKDTLNVGNLVLHFIETPGHTPGGMCILVEDCLFSGDTLFAQSIGRTDFPMGSFPHLIESIKTKLFLLPEDTKVYPGHMGSTTIGYEKRHNPFV